MRGRDKPIIKNIKKEDIDKQHMSIGAAIRNQFGICARNAALIQDAKANYLTILLASYWRKYGKSYKNNSACR
jgi:hypothetical protein